MNRLRIADRLTWLATLLAAVAAAAGLLAAGLYRDAPFWVEQARATDIATLFFAVPILVAGLLAARRGSSIGRLAAISGLLYLVYNYAIFAFSVAMNPLSVAYIAILGLAVWSLLLSLSQTDLGGAARALDGRIRRRSSAIALIAIAGLFEPGLRPRSRPIPAAVRRVGDRAAPSFVAGRLRLSDADLAVPDLRRGLRGVRHRRPER